MRAAFVRPCPALLCLGLGLSLSFAALAEEAKPLPAAQARARLEAYNAEITRAFQVLAGSYGKDPAAEQRRIDEAAQIAAGLSKAIGAPLSSAPAAYEAVTQNLRALEAELARARLAQRYSATEARVRERHAAGEPASEQDLATLEQTLAALRAEGGAGWAPTVEHFAARLERLQQDRAALASAKPAPAPAAPATTTAPPAAAPEAPNDALLAAFRAANKERRALERLLEDTSEPLPAPALAAYLEAASRVSALSERAGRYYTTVYRHFLVANAFRAPDEEAFATLPNLYQGDLVDHGSSARKALTVRVAAEEGHCYALVGRFARFTGAEAVSGLSWSAQKKGTGLARFDLPHTGPGYQVTQGVCPSEGTRLTLKATLEGAARDNPLRYVVVGWAKEQLPAFVATYMRLLDEDRCDDEAWYRAWTRPLPGSLLYRGQEPWLVVAAARPPSDEVTLVNVNGERATVQKREVTATPPSARAFTTTFSFQGCPAVSGGSPEAERLAKCLVRIEKKYAKRIEREERAIERARSDSAREKAEARLASLRDRVDGDRAQQCDPLEQRLGEKVKRTYERILDLHTDNSVIVPFDRADQLQAEQEARPDLR